MPTPTRSAAAALRRAADSAALAKAGHAGTAAEGPRATNQKLYDAVDPLASPAFSDKIALLAEIDAWARARDPRVVQVSASIVGERRADRDPARPTADACATSAPWSG